MDARNYALLIAVAVVAVCLVGCQKQGFAIKPDPIPELCEASCRTPCAVNPLIRYTPVVGSTRAFDDLVEQVVIPLKGEVAQCDTHRVACVQCLDRLKDAKITQ